jgi:hypothetical protein
VQDRSRTSTTDPGYRPHRSADSLHIRARQGLRPIGRGAPLPAGWALDARAHPMVRRHCDRWFCKQLAHRRREARLARRHCGIGLATRRRDFAMSWANTREKDEVRRVAGRGRARPFDRYVGSFQQGRGGESAGAPIVAEGSQRQCRAKELAGHAAGIGHRAWYLGAAGRKSLVISCSA